MARGNPDYFGQSTFPNYGLIKTLYGEHTFTETPEVFVMSVLTEKCLISMIEIEITIPDFDSEIMLQINVDDGIAGSFSLVSPFESRHFIDRFSPLKLSSFIPVNKSININNKADIFINNSFGLYGIFTACIDAELKYYLEYRNII